MIENSLVIIRDKVANQCTAPMCFTNDACAIRYFKSNIIENAEDYDLIKIGTYIPETGDILLCDRIILAKGE